MLRSSEVDGWVMNGSLSLPFLPSLLFLTVVRAGAMLSLVVFFENVALQFAGVPIDQPTAEHHFGDGLQGDGVLHRPSDVTRPR